MGTEMKCHNKIGHQKNIKIIFRCVSIEMNELHFIYPSLYFFSIKSIIEDHGKCLKEDS